MQPTHRNIERQEDDRGATALKKRIEKPGLSHCTLVFVNFNSKCQQSLAKRNEVGVQLLTKGLHEQIFKNVTFPKPDKSYVRLAREHLEQHSLDPTQGSAIPETDFRLPPLQGRDIDEHFYQIGSSSAQPWLDLAERFVTIDPPPKPDYWHIQPG